MRVEAPGGILAPRQNLARDGALRKTLEHQHIDGGGLCHGKGGFDPVIGEPGTGTDPQRRCHPREALAPAGVPALSFAVDSPLRRAMANRHKAANR